MVPGVSEAKTEVDKVEFKTLDEVKVSEKPIQVRKEVKKAPLFKIGPVETEMDRIAMEQADRESKAYE